MSADATHLVSPSGYECDQLELHHDWVFEFWIRILPIGRRRTAWFDVEVA